jgi:phosphate/sulfate permease/phosphate uptake regulator
LFLLAISDLVVGVSNDAVNFLNSAVGAKAASLKTIMLVAALGIVIGCTFSSGMMEVARKGIFHPEYFYFSEIMLLFLAVMVTDVILLDTFNSFGMPTSTTVSIVFELLGAAVAISVIKIYSDPNALDLGEYINSGKALAIISGILLSVVVAFTSGVIVQYLSRMLFSFNYDKRLKYFGSLWGGFAFSAITYFILIKGAKGASFMNSEMKEMIMSNAFAIIALSFVGWSIILQLVQILTKWNILKIIVLVGTFALAMAFAGNDLVNFIGVPLAGYNSYELFVANGGVEPAGFLMEGLAGKVPTPTLLLLLAGAIMTVTLWRSKKAKRVIQTSLDLGRQYEGAERFESYAISRSLVRNFSKMATSVNNRLPDSWKKKVEKQFDEKPFIAKQAEMGADAPSFDMIRAATTLVVASILISIGTALKLPLSTTYVTFMVFMGTSLADGAWGRESAVYRVSGVLSIIGGWFFTAFSAFVVAFIVATIFYFGGIIAIIVVLILSLVFIIRSHKAQDKKLEEQLAFEKNIEDGAFDKAKVIGLCADSLQSVLGKLYSIIEDSLEGLQKEDLKKLSKANKKFKEIDKRAVKLRNAASKALDKIHEDDMESAHLFILVVDYLSEMTKHVEGIIRPSLNHIDNNHKPLLPVQVEELKSINEELKYILRATIDIFKTLDPENALKAVKDSEPFVKLVRNVRKTQLKRIKNHEVGTKNSMLYLNILGEFRNLSLFSNRLVQVCYDLIINPDDKQETKKE